MDVKGYFHTVTNLLPEKTTSSQVTRAEKVETPTSIIEKGIEQLKTNKAEDYSKEHLTKQVENMNELLETNKTALKFNVHEDLNRLYVQVVSKDTSEIVKEIPPEQFLDMVASMLKHAGLIVDQRV
ncbi:flagellar protein [Halalkalibacter wakoensis JCM 9140]|uniref:Flagellar protein n=1 Tax=Halalkalibacter wakoensis JCM 9140 TaxID=1236970 RepID=W4Q385_9BACI|nr:flagellar protein FlaG [Halalkalibacter wakoensis]GAE26536.1 flagellar protein [Halalkalibacter wakoensis JCM 9140]